jgi:hypothetical protein
MGIVSGLLHRHSSSPRWCGISVEITDQNRLFAHHHISPGRFVGMPDRHPTQDAEQLD